MCRYLREASKLFFWGLNNTTKAKQAARASAERAPLSILECKKLVKLYKEFGMVEAERLARLEAERLEAERLARIKAEQLDKERLNPTQQKHKCGTTNTVQTMNVLDECACICLFLDICISTVYVLRFLLWF